jgi:hypothetical protein
MAMMPINLIGVYLMSKFTSKAMLFAVIISAGSGQMFASEVEHTDHKKKRSWSLNCFRSCMRDAANDVREAAPAIHEVGTTAIEVGKAVATVQGNKKVVRNLDKAQGVLDETLELTQANDIHAVLDAGKDIVQIVDPKDTHHIVGKIDKAEETIEALKPLIELAVANAEKKST